MTWRRQDLPPGAGHWLPATLAFLRDPLRAQQRWQRRHGDPFTAYLGPSPVVVTGTSAGIRDLFSAPLDAFAPVNLDLGEMIGRRSVLSLEGEPHLVLHRLLGAALPGAREAWATAVVAAAARRNIAGWPTGRMLNLAAPLRRLSLEIILRLLCGMTDPLRMDAFATAFATLGRRGTVSLMLLPALRRDLGAWSPWGRFLRVRARVHALLAEEIAAARAEAASARADMLSRLVRLRDAAGRPALDDETIRDNLLALLHAGHASTAAAIGWAVQLTWSTPGVLPRLRGALASFAASGDPADALAAPYLDAVCREALRFRSAAAIVARRLAQPLTVARTSVPAGVMVGASIDLSHHDPANFAEPHRFDPERFLNGPQTHGAFIPFGGGRHHCLGSRLALDEIRLVLAILATGPALRLCSHRLPRRVVRDGAFVAKGGVKIILEQRQP